MRNSLTFPLIKEAFQKSFCNVMSHALLFAYPIKLNIATKNTVTKNYVVISSDLCYAINEILYKMKR